MKVLQFFLIISYSLYSGFANSEGLKLDHVIVVVNDIKHATKTYQKAGFTIKPGRLHKNGLLNAHIKFPNHTEFELMSVNNNPTDSMAQGYSEFLESGEGGAFVALTGPSIDVATELLKSLAIEHDVMRGQFWDYIVFPKGSHLEHFFFIKVHNVYPQENWTYEHKNGVSHISEVWVEGNTTVATFLEAFGAKLCGKLPENTAVEGQIFKLSNDSLIIVTPRTTNQRQRFVGVRFALEGGDFNSINNAHGVWLKGSGAKLCASNS